MKKSLHKLYFIIISVKAILIIFFRYTGLNYKIVNLDIPHHAIDTCDIVGTFCTVINTLPWVSNVLTSITIVLV